MRAQAQARFRVAILGRDIETVSWLMDAFGASPFDNSITPLPQALASYILPTSDARLTEAATADLALILLPDVQQGPSLESAAATALRNANARLPIIVVHLASDQGPASSLNRGDWPLTTTVMVDPKAAHPLEAKLIPTLLQLFPDQHITLGHQLPALRAAIAIRMINETCLTNATYVAGTGVASLVPVLNIPLNVADMIILTKNQTLLAYKLALSLGHNGSAQELLGPIAGVLGGGFVWRQVARMLVGFIPGWGIIPKVAVAYAGTYVVGYAVYNWYAKGQQLTGAQMRELYAKAVTEAKARAAALMPRKRLALPKPSLPRPALPRRKARRCLNCGHRLGRQDHFCRNCGYALAESIDQSSTSDLQPPTPPE